MPRLGASGTHWFRRRVRTQEDDALRRDPRPRSRLARLVQKLGLRDEGLRAGVAQLEGQLGDRVQRVRGRGDAAGPQAAAGQHGGVDVVGREEGQHVATAPAPLRLEDVAPKGGGGGAEAGVRVGPGWVLTVREKLFGVWEGGGGGGSLVLEEEGEDVDFRNGYRRVEGFVRHFVAMLVTTLGYLRQVSDCSATEADTMCFPLGKLDVSVCVFVSLTVLFCSVVPKTDRG